MAVAGRGFPIQALIHLGPYGIEVNAQPFSATVTVPGSTIGNVHAEAENIAITVPDSKVSIGVSAEPVNITATFGGGFIYNGTPAQRRVVIKPEPRHWVVRNASRGVKIQPETRNWSVKRV